MGNTRRGITLIDVILVLVIVLILTTLFASVRVVSHDYAYKEKCAANLKEIGMALRMYVTDHSEWPRTRYAPDTADHPTYWTAPESSTPFAEKGPVVNDITAAYRLLATYNDLFPDVFLCPQSPVTDARFAIDRFKREHANFVDERELSYSFANPYPTAAGQGKGYKLSLDLTAEFAVAADVNPGQSAEGGVLSAGPTSSARDTRPANSPNHDRDGQNVLYGDGHVEFVQNPFVGVNRDNIYAYGKKENAPAGYGIVGSPARADDSVLLPAIDPKFWRAVAIKRETFSAAWVAVPLLIIAVPIAWAVRHRRRARPTPAL